MVDIRLKYCRRISKPEGHNVVLKVAVSSTRGNFLTYGLSDTTGMVCVSNVDF